MAADSGTRGLLCGYRPRTDGRTDGAPLPTCSCFSGCLPACYAYPHIISYYLLTILSAVFSSCCARACAEA